MSAPLGRRRGTMLFGVLGFLSLVGCNDPLVDEGEAELARAHLERVLQAMETYSINRYKIDWPAFRSTVLAQAPNPERVGDIFPAIHTALGLLGDNHSRYIAPPDYGVTISNSKISCTADLATLGSIPSDIGFVRVQGFSSASGSAEANTFTSNLHSQIRLRDTATDVVGWIVDLRGNTGGNMWPMIAGLGPILGENTVGFFVNPDSVWGAWEYTGFASRANGSIAQSVTNPYTLRRGDPKVAVLIDGRVASSGEAAAIAFKGRPNTRFFGTPSCGLSTANVAIPIDDATLILTGSTMADRTRFVYGDTLVPDENISNATTLFERAVAWLRQP